MEIQYLFNCNRDYIEVHGYKMTQRSRQYEYMKNCMIEFYPVQTVKQRTQCVSNTSCNEPEDAVGTKILFQRFKAENDDPSHSDIQHRGKDSESSGKENFKDDSGNCKTPNQPENCKTQRAVKCNKGEGRIAAGNQNINCRMIKNIEPVTEAGVSGIMIKCGSQIQRHHT